jgi:hypothetical protein
MVLGPYPLEKMRQLASQGLIGRSHQVSDDGGQTWRAGGEFPDLFVAPQAVASGAAGKASRDVGSQSAGSQEKDSSHTTGGRPEGSSTMWHYTTGGVQHPDPVAESDLRALIRQGRVRPGDQVWAEVLGQSWMPVHAIPVLAAELPSSESADVPKVRPRTQRRNSTSKARKVPKEPFNALGVSGFICGVVALTLLVVPCVVWLLIAESFFWIFNIVLPLVILGVLGLVLSVLGLMRPRRGLATAGTVLGVLAVALGVMGLIGSATIRYRLAAARRPQIDSWATDIELARKNLSESMAAFRGLQPEEGESPERFRLRQLAALDQSTMQFGKLLVAHDGHVTVTSFTSEFNQAFVDGLATLQRSVQEMQQAGQSVNLDLGEVLHRGNVDTARLKLLLDTLNLFAKGRITLAQAEAKMMGR